VLLLLPNEVALKNHLNGIMLKGLNNKAFIFKKKRIFIDNIDYAMG